MAVVTFELQRREVYAAGREFGPTGAYERFDGRLHYAVDPDDPHNLEIVDLGLAPVGSDGRVHFSGDLCILAPRDPQRGNGGLIVELPNRGRRRMPRYLLRAPIGSQGTAEIPPGDGLLLHRGYALAWIGWQWDVVRSDALMGLDAPLAFQDGRPLTGSTQLRFQPNVAHTTHLLADLSHQPYPTAAVDDPDATLWVSDYRNGPARLVPRERWQFAREQGGDIEPDSRYIYLAEGFQPGKVYDLLYTTHRAPVVGAGLLAVRDGTSYLRYATGPDNPLAGRVERVIGFGISQTARMLRHFLWLGLNLDEQGRIVFDGVLPNVGGARRGEFNHRFGQPSVQPTPSPGYLPPFDDAGLLARQRALGGVPKLVQTNTSAEYWRGDCAYLHLAPDATHDLPPDPDTRIYHFAGAQHDPSEPDPLQAPLDGSRGRYRYNWVDYTPLLRAALCNLDRWVRDGVPPPASVHPRLDDGALQPREQVLADLAQRIPNLHQPDIARLPYLWNVDPGPTAPEGVVRFPVEVRGAYPAFVAAVDADGNEIGGIRLPDLSVPLATHTGWNPRDPQTGAPEQILDYKGATHLFPLSGDEREARGDPRPPLSERYAGLSAYLARVAQAADALIAAGYVLPEDRAVLLADAELRYREAHHT
ncbi:MAG: hypothetical protein DCC58_10070 [Chloroflexi bacterium]|nr:MAG: hypothetical protein DCC58_10070 [Chloroflexota bacterium]